MRRFLLPLLFAAILAVGLVGTGHTVPTSLPITDTAWMAIVAISVVAAVPLFMLGGVLDNHHHETAGIRKAEKTAMRILKDEERRKHAEADAAELRAQKAANGDFGDAADLVGTQYKSNGQGAHFGYLD